MAGTTSSAAGIGDGPEPANVARHLDGHQRRLLADVVAARALGAGKRLAFVLGREHTERHRDAGGELDLLDASGALPRDQVVVRGLAADHGADAHHGIDPTRLRKHLGAASVLKKQQPMLP